MNIRPAASTLQQIRSAQGELVQVRLQIHTRYGEVANEGVSQASCPRAPEWVCKRMSGVVCNSYITTDRTPVQEQEQEFPRPFDPKGISP